MRVDEFKILLEHIPDNVIVAFEVRPHPDMPGERLFPIDNVAYSGNYLILVNLGG